MKKLLFIFLFISGFAFSQNKTLYKTVSYNDVITLYNTKLKLQNENLDENIERCKFIVDDAKAKKDDQTVLAFSIFLQALTNAKTIVDKSLPYLFVYKDAESNYEFFNNKNKFVGRIYKEKFDETLEIQGNKPETFLSSYFYLLQD